MSDTEDTWPLPQYNPGSRLHLHALGVISVTFVALERSMNEHYINCAVRAGMPIDLVDKYYLHLNEDSRMQAIRDIFKVHEKEKEVTALIDNLVSYFNWCRNCRNHILHSELYPPAFGGEKDTLYLIKKASKKSTKSGYMKFKLIALRGIADKIRYGVVQSAEIHIYLRYRDVPSHKVRKSLRAYVHDPLPGKLRIPRSLELSQNP